MSVHHYLHTSKYWNVNQIMKEAQKQFPNVEYTYHKNELIYAWVENESTKGINVSKEDDNRYEFRTTVCSSKADLRLANCIAKIMIQHLGGFYRDEEEIELTGSVLYPENDMEGEIQKDCELIHRMVKIGSKDTEGRFKNFSLFCPHNRQVYFGQRTLQRFSSIADDVPKLTEAMMNMILEVVYDLPDYEPGNVIISKSEDGEKEVVHKLITNEQAFIINGFDMLLFDQGKEDMPIRVPQVDFPDIRPDSWPLYDDQTIVTTPLPENEWNQLLQRARSIETPFGEAIKQEYIPLDILYSLVGEEDAEQLFDQFCTDGKMNRFDGWYRNDQNEVNKNTYTTLTLDSNKNEFSYHHLFITETDDINDNHHIMVYPELKKGLLEVELEVKEIRNFNDLSRAILVCTDAMNQQYVFYNTNYVHYQEDYTIGHTYSFGLFGVLLNGNLHPQSIKNELLKGFTQGLTRNKALFMHKNLQYQKGEFDVHEFQSEVYQFHQIKFLHHRITNCSIALYDKPIRKAPLLFRPNEFSEKPKKGRVLSGILSLQGVRLG